MSSPLGARAAVAWARVYTASLSEPARSDRRAEVEADVHDQLAAGSDEGLPRGALSRRIAMRTLRGLASDVQWRLEAEWAVDRFASLVRGTAIRTVLFAVLIPTVFVWDSRRARFASGDVTSSGAQNVVLILAALLLAHMVARGVQRLIGPRGRGRRERLRPRRLAFGVLAGSWAGAALWRDARPPYEGLGTAAWALFGLTLLVWALAEIVVRARRARRLRARPLDFGKVPS